MLRALGMKFQDQVGHELSEGAEALSDLYEIDIYSV